jgi:hypothetical protein
VFLFGLLWPESSMLFLLVKFCFMKNESVSSCKKAEECAERITPAGSPECFSGFFLQLLVTAKGLFL